MINLIKKILLIAIVIFGFTACGDSKSDEKQNTTTVKENERDNTIASPPNKEQNSTSRTTENEDINDDSINKIPTANAGLDKTVIVNETIHLDGLGTDKDGTIVSYEWKKGATILATTASFDYLPTEIGTDTLVLTVMDNDSAIATDSIKITIIADSNTEAQSGNGDTASCAGCHGAYFEKKALGKSRVVRDMSKNEIITALKGYKDGTYGGTMKGIMKGQVAGLSDADIESIANSILSFNTGSINKIPTANAGLDKTVIVNETISVEGGGTDSDGTIISYEWKKGTMILATTASFDYMPTEVGIDTLILAVTDNDGATATDTLNVVVTEVTKKEGNTHNVSTVSEFRKALEDSALNGQSDTIILDAGIYKTTEDGLGAFVFTDTEDFNLTIRAKDGLTKGDVILSGDTQHQVLTLGNTSYYANDGYVLKHLTIRDGTSSKGGGFYANRNVLVENCNITNNSGGGFYTLISATIKNSIISHNNNSLSHNSHGGGFTTYQKAIIIDSIITNNSSTGYGGGFSSRWATIEKSTISNNSAVYGGGFSTGYVTLTDSVISNNTSSNDGGGFHSTKTATIINSILLKNQGNGYYKIGGFIAPIAMVTNSNFIDNGGITIFSRGNFINNIFSGSDTHIRFLGDSKVYNNYIDYLKLENENDRTIKKNNFQPSEGVISFENGSSHRLKPTSFGIDIGLNPNSSVFGDLFTDKEQLKLIREYLQTDIAGQSRISNGVIDLGAYEVQN